MKNKPSTDVDKDEMFQYAFQVLHLALPRAIISELQSSYCENLPRVFRSLTF